MLNFSQKSSILASGERDTVQQRSQLTSHKPAELGDCSSTLLANPSHVSFYYVELEKKNSTLLFFASAIRRDQNYSQSLLLEFV